MNMLTLERNFFNYKTKPSRKVLLKSKCSSLHLDSNSSTHLLMSSNKKTILKKIQREIETLMEKWNLSQGISTLTNKPQSWDLSSSPLSIWKIHMKDPIKCKWKAWKKRSLKRNKQLSDSMVTQLILSRRINLCMELMYSWKRYYFTYSEKAKRAEAQHLQTREQMEDEQPQ